MKAFQCDKWLWHYQVRVVPLHYIFGMVPERLDNVANITFENTNAISLTAIAACTVNHIQEVAGRVCFTAFRFCCFDTLIDAMLQDA